VKEGVEELRSSMDWKPDTVWVGGGDGTAHQIVQYLPDREVELGVLPMGTVNALSRCLGYSLKIEEAACQLVRSEWREFYPLKVGGRLALCFGSLGYDARVVHGVDGVGWWKFFLGKYAYVTKALRHLITESKTPRLEIEVDGENAGLVCRGLILSRLKNYAGFHLFPEVVEAPRELAWCALETGCPMDLTLAVLKKKFGGKAGLGAGLSRKVVVRLAAEDSSNGPLKNLFLQLDGEAVGWDEVSGGKDHLIFEIDERPVKLLVAPDCQSYGLAVGKPGRES
jgi:diacylglycerol kinase family enzyme